MVTEETKAFTWSKLVRWNLPNIKALIIQAEGEQAFHPKKETKSALANRLYELLHPEEEVLEDTHAEDEFSSVSAHSELLKELNLPQKLLNSWKAAAKRFLQKIWPFFPQLRAFPEI